MFIKMIVGISEQIDMLKKLFSSSSSRSFKPKSKHHEEIITKKGWIGVIEDNYNTSLNTTRLYFTEHSGNQLWEKRGWVFQEVELKYRRLKEKPNADD